MEIAAIETRYRGYHFRSRLEARWAVFFDHLGIQWEYEPEGFHVRYRLTRCGEGTFPYLPDFWLPEYESWAEVKGTLDIKQGLRLLDAAASLSAPRGGCGYAGSPPGHDLIVLGNIPSPDPKDRTYVPWRLHMHKGDLLASPWSVHDLERPQCYGLWCIADDSGGGEPQDIIRPSRYNPNSLFTALLRGSGMTRSKVPGFYLDALVAARSARFEHGVAAPGVPLVR